MTPHGPALERRSTLLDVTGVEKRFAGIVALNDVDLQVDPRASSRPSSGPTAPASPPCSTA